MGAYAPASRRMPPVLDVAFKELARGGTKQMLAGQRRFGMHERHYVLQLITKTVGAARLVKSRAAPEPAA